MNGPSPPTSGATTPVGGAHDTAPRAPRRGRSTSARGWLAVVRGSARDAQFAALGLLRRGGDYACPCCGHRIGGFVRRGPQEICPRCRSRARHRVMALYLRKLDLAGARVLHLAPERCIHTYLRRLPDVDYMGGDLEPGRFVLRQLDARDLPFPPRRFDLVVCSHVLEHIREDTLVISEFARVVGPGGSALIQVPVDHALGATYEDPAVTEPAARRVAFGQEDHVRVYGRDVESRFRSAGVDVRRVRVEDIADAQERRRFGLETPDCKRGTDVYRLDARGAPPRLREHGSRHRGELAVS
jgi:SAM-dependent methyltransferase